MKQNKEYVPMYVVTYLYIGANDVVDLKYEHLDDVYCLLYICTDNSCNIYQELNNYSFRFIQCEILREYIVRANLVFGFLYYKDDYDELEIRAYERITNYYKIITIQYPVHICLEHIHHSYVTGLKPKKEFNTKKKKKINILRSFHEI